MAEKSPPLRGRGLKLFTITCARNGMKVAPPAGAWIETDLYSTLRRCFGSPPLRGRGLKPELYSDCLDIICRPPCGGVD